MQIFACHCDMYSFVVHIVKIHQTITPVVRRQVVMGLELTCWDDYTDMYIALCVDPCLFDVRFLMRPTLWIHIVMLHLSLIHVCTPVMESFLVTLITLTLTVMLTCNHNTFQFVLMWTCVKHRRSHQTQGYYHVYHVFYNTNLQSLQTLHFVSKFKDFSCRPSSWNVKNALYKKFNNCYLRVAQHEIW